MSEREERVEGIFATNCGLAKVRLVLADGKGSVNVTSRWMGDEPALDVTFRCRHNRLGSHSGSLVIEHAEDGATNEELVRERDASASSAADSVAVLIVRDGREQTVQVKSGRLGLPDLRPVKKK